LLKTKAFESGECHVKVIKFLVLVEHYLVVVRHKCPNGRIGFGIGCPKLTKGWLEGGILTGRSQLRRLDQGSDKGTLAISVVTKPICKVWIVLSRIEQLCVPFGNWEEFSIALREAVLKWPQ
jgi:hypothetical protein